MNEPSMIEREIREDGVRVLRLAHGRANALDLELANALTREFRAAAEEEASAVVLTGTGTIFCAGVDLVRLHDGGNDYLDGFLPALDEMFIAQFTLRLPVVAAVNGHAIAGGWVLAAGCEHRILAEGNHRLGVPELLVGVPFPLPALEILRASTPAGFLDSFLLTGRLLTPPEARQAGLIHEIVPRAELETRAVTLASSLANVPAEAYASTKLDLRAPHIDRMVKDRADHGRRMRRIWGSAAVRAAVGEYVARTLRKT